MKKFAFFAIIGIAFALLITGCVNPPPLPNLPGTEQNQSQQQISQAKDLKSFGSWDEISEFLESADSWGYRGYYGAKGGIMELDMLAQAAPTAAESGAEEATDYSTTNIQVQGVDEADIVKNDGKYIYKVAASDYYYGYETEKGKVTIINAFPPEQMEIISEIEFEGNAQEIFIYNDKLVVFGNVYRYEVYPAQPVPDCVRCIIPPYYSQNFAFMKVYDISDRTSPELEKEIEVKGSYYDSRMVSGEVYAFFSDYAYGQYPVPLYAVDGVEEEISPEEITYFDWPDRNYNFNIFVSIDLDDLEKEETRKIVLMGYSQNLFVSKENMYVSYTRYNHYMPRWPAYEGVYWAKLPQDTKEKIAQIEASDISDWRKDRLKSSEAEKFIYGDEDKNIIESAESILLQVQFDEKISQITETIAYEPEMTAINKIALDGFEYLGKGQVPGHVLNQFSMDEHNSYFRIATTARKMSRQGSTTTNNLYVLDSEMQTVGKLEDLAPGETIYSARFMGDKAYLVTFKDVDPFFVIDLSVPQSPTLLGKLKIPGYSDYLHPYDENYIIGLGKGAMPSGQEGFAWYQGVKLSLFDVTDLENPKEISKFEIGDRGTDSYALHDHKAFLFSKDRNLLVIPILLAEIDESKYAGKIEPYARGDYTFQGAYVFEVTPDDGFVFKGRITHVDDDSLKKSGDYYWSSSNVKRSLYMDEYLYTVSDAYVKANELPDLSEISSVQVGETKDPYGWED